MMCGEPTERFKAAPLLRHRFETELSQPVLIVVEQLQGAIGGKGDLNVAVAILLEEGRVEIREVLIANTPLRRIDELL